MIDVRREIEGLTQGTLRKVRRSGADNIMAVCPFHMKSDGTEERTPSFAMSLSTGLFFCHACHARGNLHTFLKDLGVDRTVIAYRYKFLIDAAKHNLPPQLDPLRPTSVYGMPRIDEAVLGLLDTLPYSLKAQFTEDTLRHFDVGYDQWHQRVTYPLRDIQGHLVGISGRNPDGVFPKYKVYTDEYVQWGLPVQSEPDKRAILWHADVLYPGFTGTTTEPLVVVEGFKACMWLWQSGMKQVVALLGSYLSKEHQWLLENIGAPVYIFLDNDYAGRRGAMNAAKRLNEKLMRVHVVDYPPHLEEVDSQPDDLQPDEILEAITTAPSYTTWVLHQGAHANVIR